MNLPNVMQCVPWDNVQKLTKPNQFTHTLQLPCDKPPTNMNNRCIQQKKAFGFPTCPTRKSPRKTKEDNST